VSLTRNWCQPKKSFSWLSNHYLFVLNILDKNDSHLLTLDISMFRNLTCTAGVTQNMRIILFYEWNLNIDISKKQICSNHRGKMRCWRHYTSQYEYKLQTIDCLLYYMNRQNDRCPKIAFWCYQNTGNEHNETLNKKYRTDDSFKNFH
jgi:hypothetical protein